MLACFGSGLFLTLETNAQQPADHRINVLQYGPPGGNAIQLAITRSGGDPYTHFFLPNGLYAITNSITWPLNSAIELAQNAVLWIYTNQVMTLRGNDLYATADPHFYGPGTVTGGVNGVMGCWPSWVEDTVEDYLVCTGLDPTQSFWPTTNQVGGDLQGTLSNLQLGTGSVTTVEILDDTILNEDIADGTIETNKLSTNVWNFVSDIAYGAAEYGHTTSNLVFFQVGTPASGSGSVIPFDNGWITTNAPMTVVAWNVKSAWSEALNCFVAPHDGVFEFKQMFLHGFDGTGDNYALGYATDSIGLIFIGMTIDNSPFGNATNPATAAAEDFFYSGSSTRIEAIIPESIGGSVGVDFSWTLHVASNSRVYPSLYYLGTTNFTPDHANSWWLFQGTEVSKGALP